MTTRRVFAATPGTASSEEIDQSHTLLPEFTSRYVCLESRVNCSPVKFEWDPEKANANVEKHGVTFEEASTAFADWDSITVPDPEHSSGEERWYLLGVSEKGNLLVVCHTERGERFRIFSAWNANKRQRKQYEDQFEEEH